MIFAYDEWNGIFKINNKANGYYTTWQLLSRFKRIPAKGARAEKVVYFFGEAPGYCWYKYHIDKTEKVDEETYQKLKALYIKKFGGWSKIDLSSTTYDGRRWW